MAQDPTVSTSDRPDDRRSACPSSAWGMPGITGLTNPVFVLDREGRVCSWNLSMEALTGVPAEQILGGTIPDGLLQARRREAGRESLERATSGSGFGPISLGLITDAGAERDFIAWPTHARDDAGEITVTAFVGVEITALRPPEAPQTGVDSRTFSHFSHGVAHRFNNLLMVIHGNLQLVRSFRAEPLDEDTLEILEDALRAAEDGTELVRGLLGVSPRERRAPEVLDLESVITEFADVVRSGLEEHTDLTVRIDKNVEVEIEFSPFKSALLHLVLNACESMPSGGALTVSVAVAHIEGERCRELGRIAPGRYALIEVGDSGYGIAPGDVQRIREPFFTTKSKSKSLGLGLTFVDDFARNAHGGLAIESRLGAGTRAVLALPVVEGVNPQITSCDYRNATPPPDEHEHKIQSE